MKRTQIYLPLAQHDYLAALAAKKSTSISEEIRKMIDSFRQDKQFSYQDEDKNNKTAGASLLKLAEELSTHSYQAIKGEIEPSSFDQYLLDDYERIKNYYR